MYVQARSNTGRKSQEGGNGPIIHRLRIMGKEVGLHTYYRIAFSQNRNKYGFILQCRSTSKTLWYVKRAAHRRLRLVLIWFQVCEISRIGKSLETDGGLLVVRGWGGKGDWLHHGRGFYFEVTSMLWNWIELVVAHSADVLSATELSTLKRMILCCCEFCFKQFFKLLADSNKYFLKQSVLGAA